MSLGERDGHGLRASSVHDQASNEDLGLALLGTPRDKLYAILGIGYEGFDNVRS